MNVEKAATISPCGLYRYELFRTWDLDLPQVVFVMLNPSKADAEVDDPTIRRCLGFARSWGYGSLCVVNLFALRATDPGELTTAGDRVGPDNDSFLAVRCRAADEVVVAWGANEFARERAAKVLADLREWKVDLWCLGLTKGGHPRHPLYVKAATAQQPFEGR